ncbi:hypothetical protein SUGI_0718900 [Cryptomeria japonica]|uniref:(R)-mandelonitrile lyase-like n=1 Tax=Cryptomeria japonica TaxID=3369 RepID=UPI00241472E1|nr:(R)-mandelonitrile lyase-like [Cryptomeria japonica]GLJ35804.1 hypothetical protein SUGI_0718900 [Cryptomeria japonica]
MEILFCLISCLLLFTNHNDLHCSAVATQKLEYPYPFMTFDAEKAAARTYDYIVIGGGTAGCPLAATLSQHYSVLLVERGDSPYGNPDTADNKGVFKASGDPNELPYVMQGFVSEEGVQSVRGRVLGGGSAINAGFYSRASSEFIREMEWDEKLVNESYEWVEKLMAFKPDKLFRWNSAVKDALLEAGVFPYNGYTVGHLEGTKFSASTFDNEGRRHTAADLLQYANPDNIVVLLNATATRVLFDSSSGILKANGVELMTSIDNLLYQVFINYLSKWSEVILSTGSIGSPQLLLLSGIGPLEQLDELNITVLLDLNSVGKMIQDPPCTRIILKSAKALEFETPQVVGIIDNSHVYIWVGSYFRQQNSIDDQYIGAIFSKVAFPLSRGELRLSSKNPKDNPFVRYNYFSHPFDVQECILAMKVLSNITMTTSIQEFAFNSGIQFIGSKLPQNILDNDALEIFCKDTTGTLWHYHGGCEVNHVIDKTFQVKGVDGLRVVDNSIFKDSPGTNPQATIMMLGRYAGIRILKERMNICEY